jgi:ABC-type multidrug transport system fused ATPase/permease subunit
MDEGTASLDAATDATIQRTLSRLRRPPSERCRMRGAAALAPAGCSLIVVAHRLETVCTTDQLLVMSQGRVLENGPPMQLAAASGVYATMLKALKEAEAATAALRQAPQGGARGGEG